MVILRWCLVIVFLSTSSAYAITPDELRELAGVADQKERQRQHRLKTDNLGQLIPPTKITETKTPPVSIDSAPSPQRAQQTSQQAVQQPMVNKHGVVSSASSVSTVATSAQPKSSASVKAMTTDRPQVMKHGPTYVANAQAVTRPGVYVAPPRTVSQSALATDAVVHKHIRFGIALGTMLSGKLVRDINNIEPGLIEIRLTSAVEGKRRALASDTRLFADKRFNSGSGRLELNVVKGITPDDVEFEVDGLVFNTHQVSGLSGIISENKFAEATDTGMKRGMIAAGREAVNALTGNNVAGRVVGVTADAVITTSEDTLQEKLRQTKHIIHVAAQPVFIRIEASF